MVVVTGTLIPVGQQNYWEDLTRVEKLDRVAQTTTAMARDYDGPFGFDPRPFVSDMKIPTLYLQGEDDPFLSFDLVREEFEKMKDSGADVSFISYEGAAHGILGVDFSSDVREWLSLKGLDL